jgi:CHAD domain-containing protein
VSKVPPLRRKGNAHKQGKEAAAVVAAGAAVLGGKLVWDKLSAGQEDDREYRLHEDETVPDGIRRIARGQLDDASDQLGKASGRQIGYAVHETRKSLKRLRALVRVVRAALGDDTYRRENAEFREAGRLLSRSRDSKVLIETLFGLTERSSEELPVEATAELRARLEDEHEQAFDALKEDRTVVDSVLAKLKCARGRTAGWTFESDGFESLAPGLERVYRRARNRMQTAAAEPTTENLHEWRKRVKDFWHASQIVRPASPKRLKRLGKRAHQLSDLLGDDHDLALLRDYVEAHPLCFEDEETCLALQALIDRRRHALQQQSFKLGMNVFKQRPKRFADTLERGWRKRSSQAPQPAIA